MNYPKEIKKIRAKIDRLEKEKHRLIVEWVNAEHPLKDKSEVISNMHSDMGEPMLIIYRGADTRFRVQKWTAKGRLYREDGITPGVNIAEWEQDIVDL